MSVKISIDKNSGFCFGVVNAINTAEKELKNNESLYCLGDIVHNNMEVERLNKKGLKIIDHNKFRRLHDCKVLIRAHGEPPETYHTALKNNITLIDSSCSVVLKLQNTIKKGYEEAKKNNGQLVIYGKEGHAEVVGLEGQINYNAIIVSDENDLYKIDYNRPIYIFSQTTKSPEGYKNIVAQIRKNLIEKGNNFLIEKNTICNKVSNRSEQIKDFSIMHDIILFVSGKKSSNGLVLSSISKKANKRSYFITQASEINKEWFFANDKSIGICGATSTPRWLMEDVAKYIQKKIFPSAVI